MMSWPFEGLKAFHYGLILCDPPWRFRTWNDKNQEKSPSRHYDLMTLDDMKVLPVGTLAAKNCVLVMWAVQAMMPEAFDLMRAWGFTPKTVGAWAKQSKTGAKWAFGTGYVMRSAAEFYVIGENDDAEFYVLGTAGKPKVAVRDVRNLIVAPVREHSRKPDQLHVDLERMYPGVPKVELFCRERRPRWDAWGNQTEKFPERELAWEDL